MPIDIKQDSSEQLKTLGYHRFQQDQNSLNVSNSNEWTGVFLKSSKIVMEALLDHKGTVLRTPT